ncbi:hypothetical protein [Alkalihalobacterium sp. APHAB7]|uniref:hypothetical protein n=1 Tax=Alkalihalobacterium sp. APHAB7 TaxID=3402081 RepID=UPI003AB0B009
MKKFILLTVVSLVCIGVWTTVVFTLLYSSSTSEELNHVDPQVEYKPLLIDEEQQSQIHVVGETSLHIENGITLQKAKELAPHLVISVDELLEIINE